MEPRAGASSHANVRAVDARLAAAGALGRVRILPDAVTTAAAAAAALDVDIGQIANSLVFDAGGRPILVLTSGKHRVDTVKVAALLDLPSVRRASPQFVRAATGQPIGGVAPIGHPSPLRTLVDVSLAAYDVVWAAGGIPHAVFPTTYDELLRITAGTAAEVA